MNVEDNCSVSPPIITNVYVLEDCYHASPPVVLFLEKMNPVLLPIPYKSFFFLFFTSLIILLCFFFFFKLQFVYIFYKM